MKIKLIVGLACLFSLLAHAQKQVLLLTTATPTAGDLAVQNHLVSLGFVVTRVTDTASQASDANGKDLIVVSSSVGSGNISTKFTAVAVPLINSEQAIYDELGIDANNVGGGTLAGQTQINIVDCTHPLAASLPSGPTTVLTGSGPIVFCPTPVASAQIIATLNDGTGRPSLFAIEAGADLNPVRIATAPARRVGLFWEATTFMTAEGLKLFDAAVAWATSLPTDPSAPIGLTAEPADQVVNEFAAASFTAGITGAPPYFIQWQRSDGAGGFTNIPGANCPSHVTAPVTPDDNGAMFFVVVSNNFSSATSRTALLTVLADTNPPTMVSAFGFGIPPTSFDLTYSEPMNQTDAQEIFNYTLSNGAQVLTAVLDVDGKTVHFTCEAITNGTVVSLNTTIGAVVRDRSAAQNALNAGDPGASVVIWTTDGSIRRHSFTGIGGGVLVSDLTNHFRFPNFPDFVDYPTILATPVDALDQYGVQILGFITPPVSGNYNFYMSSDDAGAVFLSTDETPASKRLIAFEPQWNASRDWTGTARRIAAAPENRSTTLFPGGIPLVAGQRYYIEALMKEGGGGDNLAVAWQLPGAPVPAVGSSPIPGTYLSRYNVPASVAVDQPVDQTLPQGRQATFRISVTGSPILSFQWYESGVAIPGATSSSYTTPVLSLADSGKKYAVVVANDFSTATSRDATLTVLEDTNPPVVLSAAALDSMNIGICFDEALDPITAGDPASYSVNGGSVPVTSATLRYDNQTVALLLGAPLSGNNFTVTVQGVRDAAVGNAIGSSTTNGNVAGLTAVDIGTPGDPVVPGSTFTCRDGEFEIIAGGSDIWGTADHGHIAYQTLSGNFDKRVLLARIDNTDPSAKGQLMVRESLSADSRALHADVMPPPSNPSFTVVGRNIYEAGQRIATVGATTGWGILGGGNGNIPATHPNSWLRLRRIGNTFSAFASTNGADWTKFAETIQSYPVDVFFGLSATAHNNDGRTNRVLFQNLSETAFPGAVVTITPQPVNATVEDNHNAMFTIGATVAGAPASELSFQWQRDDGAGAFTNIFGANGGTFSPLVRLADSGAQFRVIAFVPGASATSTVATLTVITDTTPPRLVTATRDCFQTNVVVVFDELVDPATASDWVNYAIFNDTESVTVNISPNAVVMGADGRSVVLNTDIITNRASYRLLVQGVSDFANNAMPQSEIAMTLIGARAPVGGVIVVEAENYDATVAQGSPLHSWVFSSAPGGNGTFSGAGYMQALPETGAAINEPGHLTGSPRLDYCVDFPVAGIWYVWLRGNDIVGGGNSCHIGIDNADSTDPNDNRIGNSGGATGWGDATWKWTRDADVNTRIAFVTVPSAGIHTFSVWMREDSVIVDKILLTASASFTLSPNTVLGPAENPRQFTAPAPVITLHPQSQTVNQGGAASFSGVALGQALTYQWRHDGTPIANATNATLTIASAQQSDAGTYDVVVSNPAGSVTSNPATLTVNAAAPLQIVAGTPTRTGDNFSLGVTTQLGAAYILQFKDDLNDPAWTDLQPFAGNGSVMTITDTTATGSKRFYRVQVQ